MPMTLKEQIVSDVSAVLINSDELAGSITYLDADGAVSTPAAVVVHRGSVEEIGRNHRVRVDAIAVAAATADLSNLNELACVRIDEGEPYDFTNIESQSGGLTTAIFQRRTILETGQPAGEL